MNKDLFQLVEFVHQVLRYIRLCSTKTLMSRNNNIWAISACVLTQVAFAVRIDLAILTSPGSSDSFVGSSNYRSCTNKVPILDVLCHIIEGEKQDGLALTCYFESSC